MGDGIVHVEGGNANGPRGEIKVRENGRNAVRAPAAGLSLAFEPARLFDA